MFAYALVVVLAFNRVGGYRCIWLRDTLCVLCQHRHDLLWHPFLFDLPSVELVLDDLLNVVLHVHCRLNGNHFPNLIQ